MPLGLVSSYVCMAIFVLIHSKFHSVDLQYSRSSNILLNDIEMNMNLNEFIDLMYLHILIISLNVAIPETEQYF